MSQPPLKTFRNSPWRYSQFVVVGAIVAALVYFVTTVGALVAVAVGAAAGIGLWLVEKKRGVI